MICRFISGQVKGFASRAASCYQQSGRMVTSCQHQPQERYLLAIQQAATWKKDVNGGCVTFPTGVPGTLLCLSNCLHPSKSKMRNQLAPANLFLDVQPSSKFVQLCMAEPTTLRKGWLYFSQPWQHLALLLHCFSGPFMFEKNASTWGLPGGPWWRSGRESAEEHFPEGGTGNARRKNAGVVCWRTESWEWLRMATQATVYSCDGCFINFCWSKAAHGILRHASWLQLLLDTIILPGFYPLLPKLSWNCMLITFNTFFSNISHYIPLISNHHLIPWPSFH